MSAAWWYWRALAAYLGDRMRTWTRDDLLILAALVIALGWLALLGLTA